MKNILGQKDVSAIFAKLKSGAVGVFPTDTVYGLGGRADKLTVIKKVYRIKKRDKKKPLLILVSSFAMAKKYVKINREQENWLKRSWPGKLTAVLPDRGVLSPELAGDGGKLGVRFPDNDFLIKLIRRLQAPLIATSANVSDQPSVLDAKDIKVKADFIVDGGKLPQSKESTVADLTEEEIKILRQGEVRL